mmetsp:Transcript_114338/g.186355  ORF Transcript_114338/g.186355 Transcript_114338/m.186355 type:complete len:210 (+) Transcript_114338:1304-1933(+)
MLAPTHLDALLACQARIYLLPIIETLEFPSCFYCISMGVEIYEQVAKSRAFLVVAWKIEKVVAAFEALFIQPIHGFLPCHVGWSIPHHGVCLGTVAIFIFLIIIHDPGSCVGSIIAGRELLRERLLCRHGHFPCAWLCRGQRDHRHRHTAPRHHAARHKAGHHVAMRARRNCHNARRICHCSHHGMMLQCVLGGNVASIKRPSTYGNCW